jgi:hypothetical protein
VDYELGDIILLNKFFYPDGTKGTLHGFVIIGMERDEFEVLPFEYLCFLISSQKEKEKYLYNVPIKKDNTNRLQKDSHVKCDYMYTGIKKDDILMKVGYVTEEQFDLLIDTYLKSEEDRMNNLY